MVSVNNVVVGILQHVPIPAQSLAMAKNRVPLVRLPVMSNVVTQNARENVTNPALHAPRRDVSQNAPTPRARCHVLLHATMSHAQSDAIGNLSVGINVRRYVASNARLAVTAKFAETRRFSATRSISLWAKPTKRSTWTTIRAFFPAVGIFLTMESMDGKMDLRQHYEADADEKPMALKSSLRPFSMDDIKSCCACRGPLRDIARYGRLIRRSLLGESTKKLILFLNREYVPLATELPRLVQALQELPKKTNPNWPRDIKIFGARNKQVGVMRGIMGGVCPNR